MLGNINFLDEETKEILKGSVSGMYLRKRGDYDPSNGWCRKWTHKIGWIGGGDNIRLVAMTDGMITKDFSKGSLSKWISDYDMVFMSKGEMIEFMECSYEQ